MNRIKELRLLHKMNQEDLAQVLNVQRATVSRYEAGAIPIPIDSLIKLSDYFNVSTDCILGKAGFSGLEEARHDYFKNSDDEFEWLNELSADEIAEKCFQDFHILFSRSNKSTKEQMKGFYIDTFRRFNS